jgi:PTH1 family peptidyl-tRNA hydrolase
MGLSRRFQQFRRRLGGRSDDFPIVEDQTGGELTTALVIGLGNPGAEYGKTRHNVGAWGIRRLASRHGVQLQRHGRVDRASIDIDGHAVTIGRPRAMMNVSGPPIAAELKRLGLRPEQLLVIYDDLDLPVGRLRLRASGGSGGNNALKSIISALGGSTEFPRLRIGIDRPYDDGEPVRDPERIADWVLSEPSREHREILEAATQRAVEVAETAAREGIEAAMRIANTRD